MREHFAAVLAEIDIIGLDPNLVVRRLAWLEIAVDDLPNHNAVRALRSRGTAVLMGPRMDDGWSFMLLQQHLRNLRERLTIGVRNLAPG
jgi:hypothetical protein